MSLKNKIVFLVSAVFVLLLVVTHVVQQQIMVMSFDFLERRQATGEMNRCTRAIEGELDQMAIFCEQWPGAEGAGTYIRERKAEYIIDTMTPPLFTSNRLNFLAICDGTGRVLWSRACELPSLKILKLRPFADGSLPGDSPLLRCNGPKKVAKGMLRTEHGPLMVCSRPVSAHDSGGRNEGYLVVGRFLDSGRIRALAEQTGVKLEAFPLDPRATPPDHEAILKKIGPGAPLFFGESTSDARQVYTTISDMNGSPLLLLRAEVPRSITARGTVAIRFATLSSVVAMGFIVFFMWTLLHRIVVDPLARLTEHATTVGRSKDLSARIEVFAHDEIGSLAREFNQMVANLAESRSRLIDSANLLRATLDGLRDAVLILDASADTVVDCNPAAAEIFGRPRDRLIGIQVSDLHASGGEHERLRSLCRVGRDEREPLERLSIQMRRTGGAVFPAEYTLIPIADPNGQWVGWVNVIADLTERHRAEAEKAKLREQLFQTQKLEAVGRLAGSVSHDFSNFLAVVRGGTDKLREMLPDDGPTRAVLNSMVAAAGQAAEVARSLLAISRPTASDAGPLNLCEVVEEATDLLRNLLPASIELCVDPFEDDPLRVQANRTRLQQVILNLVINARDAMPNGGRVRITLHRTAAENEPDREGVGPGEWVALTVRDTGQGMSPEVQEHVFEPFFTTKKTGSGLGLAIIRNIVEEYGGHIEFQSNAESGSTFTVTLPLLLDRANESSTGGFDAVHGNGETLLLVGAQRHVREVSAAALESFGYRVLQADNAPHAVDLCGNAESPVQLVIIDGDDQADAAAIGLDMIRAAAGAVPAILLASGHVRPPAADLEGHTVAMRKPFPLGGLAATVARMIGLNREVSAPHG